VTWFEATTNGLVYEQIIVSLPDLHPEEVQLLGLYCDCLTELGIGERNYLDVQTWQAAVSGGISASCSVCGEIDNVQHARAFVRIEGSGLERNHAGLAELLKETLQSVRFDETERLQELIAQNRAYREAAVTDHGHMLALAAACAGMSPAGAINDQWNGLMGLRQLKALDEELQEGQKRAEFAVRLAKIHEKIKNSPFQLLVVGEQRELEKYVSQLEVVWRDTPNEHSHRKQLSLQPLSKRMKQGWATSTQVNFCARAYPTVPADHQDAPALTVLGRFLHNGYLHTAIREQGGAYGSGAAYDSNTGAFHFYSYRDPRLDGTLEDFDRSLE
jgi:Zn-dependent M16 (insulinase) family peptidase